MMTQANSRRDLLAFIGGLRTLVTKKIDIFVGVAILCVFGSIYFASPVRDAYDGNFSFLMAEHIWKNHSLHLEQYVLQEDDHITTLRGDPCGQLVSPRGHVYY